MNKHTTKPVLPDYYMIDGVKCTDKTQIVNKFNDFFSSIGQEIGNNVPRNNTSFTDYLPQTHNKSIFFDPATPNDITRITTKLKNKSSHGHDLISTKLLKLSIGSIVTPLTHIINQSMQTGIVPSKMKIARVIPIFKTGDKHSFNSYRPISLLPSFSKILEKTIANKLIKYLETEKLLYKHQYGFRPNHNTIHPIIHLLNHIAQENDTDPFSIH